MRKVLLICFSVFLMTNIFAQSDSILINESHKIYTIVEKMPYYPGSEFALYDTIQKNIVYPAMERDNHIQGTVVVGFIINEDGSVSDVKIKKGVSFGLDKEAMRIAKNLKFKPGMQGGKAVRVAYHLPVLFKL